MRYVLDVHHSRHAAARLRDLGVDVIAASDEPSWAIAPDDELLEFAASTGRAIVTENVKDFAPLAGDWAQLGRSHGGIVFTSPRRFPRFAAAYPSTLVEALVRHAGDHTEQSGLVEWLT